MTHFEYIAIIVSIILGLGVIRLLSSLETVFLERRYWPHAAWVLSLFWLHVQNWWGLWELRALAFNAFSYSVVVGFVSTMYLCAVALTNRASNGTSWKEHFYSQRRWFFGAFALTIVVAVLSTYVFLDAPLIHPYRFVQLSFFALAVLGFISERESVQKFVSASSLLLSIFGISAFRFLPDMFGSAS
ncbi:MAG: hypothetical protein AAGC71_13845 [Pseudomonadota bacterium]